MVLLLPLHVDAKTDEEIYNEIMSPEGLGQYLMVCQPDDALVLNNEVVITADNLTDNYDGGVVNLPRLASDYYYVINDSEVGLTETMYPSLRFTTAAGGRTVTLKILSETSSACVYSCRITIANEGMKGYDYFYPDGLPDVSENVVKYFMDNGFIFGDSSDGDYVTLYDHSLHANSIIFSEYQLTVREEDCLFSSYSSPYTLDEAAYTFKRKAVSDKGNTVTCDVKDYLIGSNSYRSGLLVGGSKVSSNCTYDSNTGNVTTVTELSDKDAPLYYIIATSEDYYIGKISTETVYTDTLTEVDASAPAMSWKSNKQYRLHYGTNWSDAGFVEEPSDADLLEYGPVSYDSFWTRIGSDISSATWTRYGNYTFLHDSYATYSGLNVFADTLIYSGCIPHLGTATLQKAESQVTLNFYYKVPGTTSNWSKLGDSVTVEASELSESNLLSMPEKQYYTANCWYTDTDLKAKFDISSVNTESNSSIDLYGEYVYSGPNYSVTFYNDKTDARTTADFQMDQQPVLPTDPTGTNGYVFKNWHIVSDEMEASGTLYNPNSFTPEAGRNYIFKTMWDVKGVIVKVLTYKANYYLGQEVDKSTLQVYVQDSSDVNNTRVLAATEYTIENALIDEIGKNQFIITYTATGATKVCEVTGLEVKPISISATYLGGETVDVGTELTKDVFNVELKYNNGTSEELNDFSLSPTTVSELGSNKITISYGNFTTTVTIMGVEEDTSSPDSSEVTLKSIEATYVGPNLNIGDKIKASDIVVVAKYSDGSTKTISSSKFKFKPSTVTSSGFHYITVTYGGCTSLTYVYVESDEKDTGKESNSSDRNTSSSDTSTSDKPSTSTSTSTTTTTTTSTSTGKKTETTKSDDKSSSTSSKSSDEKGASIGYINGLTIIDGYKAAGNNVSGVNTVDIKKAITEAASSAESLDITLINGNTGNTLTTEMQNLLVKKGITLNVKMVSASNNEVTVAKWSINGKGINKERPEMNLNVNCDVTAKETDKLFCFSISGASFPTGCSLTVCPTNNTYESGELVRLYTCNLLKENAHCIKTFAWVDNANEVPVDIYVSTIYCLSNSGNAYAEGASLMTDVDSVSLSDNSVSGNSIEEDEYDDEVSDEEEFDWDAEVELDEETAEVVDKAFGIGKIIAIVVGAAFLIGLIGTIVIIVLVVKKKKK